MILFLIHTVYSQLLYDKYEYNEINYVSQVQGIQRDIDCLELLQNSTSHNEIIGRQVLYHSITNGWNESSRYLIGYYNKNEIDVYEIFYQIKKIKHDTRLFEELTHLLPQHSATLNVVEPCYLWAQNMTHLLMKIKFTSKIDVPGAQDMNNLDINITMPALYINAYSFHLQTRYILKIQTYKFMNPYYYNVKTVELGQLYLEVLKSPTPYFWRNIHSDWFYNPPNQYMWTEMYYQYRQQLEVAFGLLEDAENMREENEMTQLWNEEKQIASNRKLKKMTESNTELHTQLYCRDCRPLDPDQWSSWII